MKVWLILAYIVGFFFTMYMICQEIKAMDDHVPIIGVVLVCFIWPFWWIWVAFDKFWERKDKS